MMDDASEDPDTKMEVLPTTESDASAVKVDSSLTDEQTEALRDLLKYLYDYRDESGHDPSKVFHKRVNKRNLPDYYDVIKDPMAFSNLKQGLLNDDFKSIKQFVRDCALIWHNAHTYNRPDAGAYQDASTIKGLMEERLKNLVENGLATEDDIQWPELGEIPPVEDAPEEDDEDDDEEGDGEAEDGEDDEDDEIDDSDEDAPRVRRKGRPSLSKRDTDSKARGEPEGKKRRGRPPKVDTPMEARMKNILKGIRKPKGEDGVIMVHAFEKLPDKASMPEYYHEISHPVAIEQIKKFQKRKRYKSVDQFMKDIDLMFENAKHFNEDGSEIYRNAVFLQKEAHRIAEVEKSKSDDQFVMDEGRKPRPDGITYNGEVWKVGDWVHIRNFNDISKPIIAQIYRTWEDAAGSPWVNACWYYRPEQTVHHYEKHFFPGEVVKTGQYRDHPIEDVIERCFVMFFTRYSRGRPRGLAPKTEVYVCEARYNEEKHKMNKIKTWASCLPDEVRDKDYEMDLFEGVKKVKKLKSPLLHLLKDDEKDDQTALPKPRWGAENAPPIAGGVYKGPRDENQSPPPEPTPSPPPQPPPPPPRQSSQMYDQNEASFRRAQDLLEQAGRPFGHPPEQASTPQQQSTHTPQPRTYSQSTPVATPQYQPQATSGQQHSYGQQNQHPNSYQASPSGYNDHLGTPQQPRYQQQHRYSANASSLPASMNQRHENVFVLPDSANAQIPQSIREQYHHDDSGRVFFFAQPPMDVRQPIDPALGHSLKYKAAKIKRDLLIKRRKEEAQASGAKKEEEEREASGAARNESGETRRQPPEIDALVRSQKIAEAKRAREIEQETRRWKDGGCAGEPPLKIPRIDLETGFFGRSLWEYAAALSESADSMLNSLNPDDTDAANRAIREHIGSAQMENIRKHRDEEEAERLAAEQRKADEVAARGKPRVYRDDTYFF